MEKLQDEKGKDRHFTGGDIIWGPYVKTLYQ